MERGRTEMVDLESQMSRLREECAKLKGQARSKEDELSAASRSAMLAREEAHRQIMLLEESHRQSTLIEEAHREKSHGAGATREGVGAMSDGERESLLTAKAERDVLLSSLSQAKHRANELSALADCLRGERDALSESLSLAKGQRDAAREGLTSSRAGTEALLEELERAR